MKSTAFDYNCFSFEINSNFLHFYNLFEETSKTEKNGKEHQKNEARKSIIIIFCDIYRIKNVNLNNSHTEDRIPVDENTEIKIIWLTDV